MQGDRVTGRLPRGRALIVVAAAVALLATLGAATAMAAAPVMKAVWASEVSSSAARLWGELELDPTAPTLYHFEYLPEENYTANIDAGRDPFANASSKTQ